jgi:hypothetical protein
MIRERCKQRGRTPQWFKFEYGEICPDGPDKAMKATSSAKQPFFGHTCPYKILSNRFRFSVVCISKQFFYRTKPSALRPIPKPGGPGLSIYVPRE